jgi:hypothetical protein
LAGPLTFIYSGDGHSAPAIFNYDVVPNDGIQTLVATNNSVIQVPSGKRLRLLDGSYPLNLAVTLTNMASASFLVTPSVFDVFTSGATCHPEWFELAGPLTITIRSESSSDYFYATYYFASDVTQVLGQAVQSPAGSMVTVEKSTDLQSWYPEFTTTEKTAPKAFYRLQVTR